MNNQLTPKQEKFCQKYIELGNASEAYRQSYDAENMKGATIKRKAAELLANGNVTARVRALQEMHMERHKVTIDSITSELIEDRAFAIKRGQAAAAVSATLGKAKLHGLLVDRIDATVRKPLSEMTDEELNAAIAEAETRAGSGLLPGATH